MTKFDEPQGFKPDGLRMTKEEFEEALKLVAAKKATAESDESRASARTSTVERRIIKDSDQCPLCVANNDPRKVPVHPNCHCNVVTDEVETGTVEPGHRLLEVLRRTDEFLQLESTEDFEDAGIQLIPETVAVFESDNVRWADLARWLEKMEPHLNNVSNYVAIVIDEDTDEAVQEIEEAIQTIAEGAEGATLEALANKRLWFSIAQSVVF